MRCAAAVVIRHYRLGRNRVNACVVIPAQARKSPKCACYNASRFKPDAQLMEVELNKKDPGGKTSRREQRRAERRRQSFFWNALILGVGGLTLALVGFYVFLNLRPGELPGEQVIPDEGKAVVSPGSALPEYRAHPPSSGTHYSEGLPWSTAETDLSAVLAEGYYLNNLARGGVVFLYACPGDAECAALEDQFRALLKAAPRDPRFNEVRILIGRYGRDLPAPIVALAWGRQLDLAQFSEDTLLTWYRRFVNLGPNVRQ